MEYNKSRLMIQLIELVKHLNLLFNEISAENEAVVICVLKSIN
jgi:hypothetical protein